MVPAYGESIIQNQENDSLKMERKHMRKAVFFDIDGTIWDEKHQIPDSTREAFRKMKDQGHYLSAVAEPECLFQIRS